MLTPEELETLKDLYQEMADHTQPVCANECRITFSCCAPEYCDFTMLYAKDEYEITLQPTGHKTLPLMGEKGCTAPPYLRPLCTVHTCQIASMGNYPKRLEWSNRYWDLRGKIEILEWKRKENLR